MLKTGDKAPDFAAQDQDGKVVSLADVLAGGKSVILYFYPKDNTPGCTAEACSLRDGYSELSKKGFVVLGVSADSAASHAKFIEKYGLPFTLLVDADHRIAEAYGTWGEKKFMGRTYMGMIRTTFIIGTDGVIAQVFDKVKTKDHFGQILEWYESEKQ
ncbi:thioredoxin-dependent thiol peroxidase [Rikenella microfusus]|uniref:thioredoxin-dependent thiol peroxidase n=1 Tax=Rikenella microfusus TaxID=28139 RepID=UPI003A8ECF7F